MKKRAKKSSSKSFFTIGRDAFAKISAVEGIKLTGSVKRELQEFDRAGLSPKARRAAVLAKFNKRSA